MDKIHLRYPTFGVLPMQDELEKQGYRVNKKRIRRFKGKMRISTLYPKRNLSKQGKAKYIYPYLLRNLEITRPNQVWSIDISYIPVKKGFMYLTPVMDVYSRFTLGWQLSNSLDKETQTGLVKDLFERYGARKLLSPIRVVNIPVTTGLTV